MRVFIIAAVALVVVVAGSLAMTYLGINGIAHMLWGALVGMVAASIASK